MLSTRHFALAAALAAHAPALAQITISDTEFGNTLWSHAVLWSLPVANVDFVVRSTGGGNPGPWQHGRHTTNGPFAAIYDGHLYTGVAYNPAIQGGIAALDISYDIINVTPGSIQSGLLVAQGGRTYFRVIDSGDHETWTAVGLTGILQTDSQWQEATPAGIASARPNFSATAEPMTFGYYAFNWSLPVGFLIEREWGIDNFRITIHPAGAPCYANCDGSAASPVLNIGDFTCFQKSFAAGESYANCDGSSTPPVLNVNDFICFLNRFSAGCP